MPSLLVTNDFPPKVGGIQSYLYELWRRLPAEETTVLAAAHPEAVAWDARQPFRVDRTAARQLWPTARLARSIDSLAREVRADIIFLDPWWPMGALGPRLRAAPYAVIVHGSEVTVPRRVPLLARDGARSLRGACAVVAAGAYPARQAVLAAGGALPGLVVPPGVDVDRFVPHDARTREGTRRRFGLDLERLLVLGVSRLVPRKGFDVLIDAVAATADLDFQLAIAGTGRDRRRLERRAARARLGERVQFLGRVPDDDLPALYAAADVFAMPCRSRWGGWEAEGFGIVFLEAAAAGVAALAGRSGGSSEAVAEGVTGVVVDGGTEAVAGALRRLGTSGTTRSRMAAAARARAVREFSYEHLVEPLAALATGDLSGLGRLS